MIINMHLSYQIDNENKTIILHKYSFLNLIIFRYFVWNTVIKAFIYILKFL